MPHRLCHSLYHTCRRLRLSSCSWGPPPRPLGSRWVAVGTRHPCRLIQQHGADTALTSLDWVVVQIFPLLAPPHLDSLLNVDPVDISSLPLLSVPTTSSMPCATPSPLIVPRAHRRLRLRHMRSCRFRPHHARPCHPCMRQAWPHLTVHLWLALLISLAFTSSNCDLILRSPPSSWPLPCAHSRGELPVHQRSLSTATHARSTRW